MAAEEPEEAYRNTKYVCSQTETTYIVDYKVSNFEQLPYPAKADAAVLGPISFHNNQSRVILRKNILIIRYVYIYTKNGIVTDPNNSLLTMLGALRHAVSQGSEGGWGAPPDHMRSAKSLQISHNHAREKRPPWSEMLSGSAAGYLSTGWSRMGPKSPLTVLSAAL